MSDLPTEPNTLITRYADAERIYRPLGYSPIPVGTDKRPLGKGWAKLQPSETEIAKRVRHFPDANFGFLAGSAISGEPEQVQAFVDIDHDAIVSFIRKVLGECPTAKVGQKGQTIFARVAKEMKSRKFLGPGGRPAVELMISSGMVVIPDSQHPSGHRYRWIGTPANIADAKSFPVLDQRKTDLIEKVIGNQNAWDIMLGGPQVAAHVPMLSLTSSGIAHFTDDLAWLAECLKALFPPGYAGNTANEVLGMLQSAKEKGLGAGYDAPRDYKPGAGGPIPLGYTKDGLYALLDPVRQIIITASSGQLLSPQYLVGIAPSSFWGEQFPSRRGVNWGAAGEALIAACRNKGAFNPAKVRGRGVWREGNRVLINLGAPIDSRKHLYLCFEPIDLERNEALDPARLLQLLQQFHWRNPQDAMMLFGWFALAPVCGVLNWRPHAFVYGPPGSGKTTIHSLAAALLDPLVIAADGQSSEAGIRQTLGPDSLCQSFSMSSRATRARPGFGTSFASLGAPPRPIPPSSRGRQTARR